MPLVTKCKLTKAPPRLNYYADNCITRINSFRDKAAVVAWAYYCPFNPEKRDEVLGFADVVDRLRYPVRYGLRANRQGPFLNELGRLEHECFNRAKTYRDRKIRRLEPKIVMRRPSGSVGLSYMIPLLEKEKQNRWRSELAKMYPDERLRRRVEQGCYIGQTLFGRWPPRDQYWCYREVETFSRECMHSCIDAAKGLSAILRRRAPLRGKC